MTRTKLDGTIQRRRRTRDVRHLRRDTLTEKNRAHQKFLLREIRNLDPRKGTADAPTLIVTRGCSDLIKPRRKLWRIRERNVRMIGAGCRVLGRRSADN